MRKNKCSDRSYITTFIRNHGRPADTHRVKQTGSTNRRSFKRLMNDNVQARRSVHIGCQKIKARSAVISFADRVRNMEQPREPKEYTAVSYRGGGPNKILNSDAVSSPLGLRHVLFFSAHSQAVLA